MSLLSACWHRLNQRGHGAAPALARRHAAAARLTRLTRPAPADGGRLTDRLARPGSGHEPDAEQDHGQGCGWFDSSHALRQGLVVTEWAEAEQAEGLLAWHAARWISPAEPATLQGT